MQLPQNTILQPSTTKVFSWLHAMICPACEVFISICHTQILQCQAPHRDIISKYSIYQVAESNWQNIVVALIKSQSYIPLESVGIAYNKPVMMTDSHMGFCQT